MARRMYFRHFEITRTCMQAGVRNENPNLNSADPGQPDVLDNLADKLRRDPEVVRMLSQIGNEGFGSVFIGVGREVGTPHLAE